MLGMKNCHALPSKDVVMGKILELKNILLCHERRSINQLTLVSHQYTLGFFPA